MSILAFKRVHLCSKTEQCDSVLITQRFDYQVIIELVLFWHIEMTYSSSEQVSSSITE